MPTKRYFSIPLEDRGWLNSVREVSIYCGVSISTIRRWHKTIGFPLLNLFGKRMVVSKTLVDQWMLMMMKAQYKADTDTYGNSHPLKELMESRQL